MHRILADPVLLVLAMALVAAPVMPGTLHIVAYCPVEGGRPRG